MIFVTVGSVFPFDRLVQAADDWALENNVEVLAQIGHSDYKARSLKTVKSLPNKDYRDAVANCKLVVSHAGMGSIITAAEYAKPIVIVPRRLSRGEHNTNHQVDTAEWMSTRSGVYVAREIGELGSCIELALKEATPADVSKFADQILIQQLRKKIFEGSELAL